MMLTSMGQVAAARVPAFLTKFDVPVYKLTDSNGKKISQYISLSHTFKYLVHLYTHIRTYAKNHCCSCSTINVPRAMQ